MPQTFWLVWTEPTTNADGTPLHDLGWARISATFNPSPAKPETLWSTPFPVRGREGLVDSIRCTLPPNSIWEYTVSLYTADTLFNWSGPSNLVATPCGK